MGARQRSSILRENVRRRKRLAVLTLPALVETALSFFLVCTFAVRSLRFFFGRSFLIAVVFFDFFRLCFDRKERFGFEMVFSSMAFFLCGIFSLLIINSSSGKVSIFPNISVLSYRSFDRICNIYPTFVKDIISYRSVLRKYFLTRSPGLAQRICAIKVLEK